MNLDTPIWLTHLCDADLRNAAGFKQEAEKMTLAECLKVYEVFNKRKAALPGGHSSNA